jgi:hypothetical protein
MAGVFQVPNLSSAAKDYTFPGAGKTQTGDQSRTWDGVFGMAAASSQGKAANWSADNDFAAQIWSPAEFGGTSRQVLPAAAGIGAAGIQGFAGTKSTAIEAKAMKDAQKRQAGGGWASMLTGALGLGLKAFKVI